MATYGTESQWNILADWSDDKLLELAGTNEGVDAEIERRGLNIGTTQDIISGLGLRKMQMNFGRIIFGIKI